jgi:hypothetical protein
VTDFVVLLILCELFWLRVLDDPLEAVSVGIGSAFLLWLVAEDYISWGTAWKFATGGFDY